MAGKGNRMKKASKEEVEVEEVIEAKPEKKKPQKQKEAKAKESGNRLLEIIRDERTHKISGLMLIVVSAFLLIAFISYFFTWRADQSFVTGSWFDLMRYSDYRVENWLGKIGAIASHQFMHQWFGISSFAFVLLAFVAGFRILFKVSLLPGKKTFMYSLFALLFCAPVLAFIFQSKSELLFLGGGLGFEINKWLSLSIGTAGAGILLGFVGLAFAVVVFNIEFKLPMRKAVVADFEDTDIEPMVAGNRFRDEERELSPELDLPLEVPDIHVHRDEIQPLINAEEDSYGDEELSVEPVLIVPAVPTTKEVAMDVTLEDLEMAIEETPVEKPVMNIDSLVNDKEVDLLKELGEYDPTLDLSSYQYPILDLLENYQSSRSQMSRDELMAELEANKKKIIETLGHYDIEIDKIKATVGPTVTLFEIVPKAGIRISKIKNLEDDIALSLAALGIR
ncbi:MAG: DNA translocase FtsK 4TM domain-containing protein, partial [Bacteroidota bacterium]